MDCLSRKKTVELVLRRISTFPTAARAVNLSGLTGDRAGRAETDLLGEDGEPEAAGAHFIPHPHELIARALIGRLAAGQAEARKPSKPGNPAPNIQLAGPGRCRPHRHSRREFLSFPETDSAPETASDFTRPRGRAERGRGRGQKTFNGVVSAPEPARACRPSTTSPSTRWAAWC